MNEVYAFLLIFVIMIGLGFGLISRNFAYCGISSFQDFLHNLLQKWGRGRSLKLGRIGGFYFQFKIQSMIQNSKPRNVLQP